MQISKLILILIIVIVVALGGFGAYVLLFGDKIATSVTNDTSNQTQQQAVSETDNKENNDSMSASVELEQKTSTDSFAPRILLRNGYTSNWSGYAVASSLSNPTAGSVSQVSGSWVVPTVTCGSTDSNSAAWVGIDGYNNETVEQIGTQHTCDDGQAKYSAWYQMYPKPSFKINMVIRAGDMVSAEVKYVEANKFSVTLSNITTGKSFTTIQRSAGLRQSAEWIVEATKVGSRLVPLARFSPITFSNASVTINGVTGSIAAFEKDNVKMANEQGKIKATKSVLSSDGSGFAVSWVKAK